MPTQAFCHEMSERENSWLALILIWHKGQEIIGKSFLANVEKEAEATVEELYKIAIIYGFLVNHDERFVTTDKGMTWVWKRRKKQQEEYETYGQVS